MILRPRVVMLRAWNGFIDEDGPIQQRLESAGFQIRSSREYWDGHVEYHSGVYPICEFTSRFATVRWRLRALEATIPLDNPSRLENVLDAWFRTKEGTAPPSAARSPAS
jgi:hypothetical protein